MKLYHGRFKGSHYETGFQYGALLKNHSTMISGSPTFTITDERKAFAKSCLPVYREYYPAAVNCFHPEAMKEYRTPPDVDSWHAEERNETARNALAEHGGAYSLDFCQDVLSGKYGFICQYDRKTNADTVWSAIYHGKICVFIAWRATRQGSRSKRMPG